MSLAANLLVALLALEHVWILVMEMFLWTRPYGLRAFGLTPQQAADSAVLAKNQGLYNGFLAAGLFWGLAMGASPARSIEAWHIKLFFAGCVFVAGIYGFATTGKRNILFGQAVFAAITLAALLLLR